MGFTAHPIRLHFESSVTLFLLGKIGVYSLEQLLKGVDYSSACSQCRVGDTIILFQHLHDCEFACPYECKRQFFRKFCPVTCMESFKRGKY